MKKCCIESLGHFKIKSLQIFLTHCCRDVRQLNESTWFHYQSTGWKFRNKQPVIGFSPFLRLQCFFFFAGILLRLKCSSQRNCNFTTVCFIEFQCFHTKKWWRFALDSEETKLQGAENGIQHTGSTILCGQGWSWLHMRFLGQRWRVSFTISKHTETLKHET